MVLKLKRASSLPIGTWEIVGYNFSHPSFEFVIFCHKDQQKFQDHKSSCNFPSLRFQMRGLPMAHVLYGVAHSGYNNYPEPSFVQGRTSVCTPPSINCLVRVIFALKMGRADRRKQKSSEMLNKKRYILPVGYITCSSKQMLFQLPIYHQNKGKKVRCIFLRCIQLLLFISLYIYQCYLYLLCVFYLCLAMFQLVMFLFFSFHVLTMFQLIFIGDKLGLYTNIK